MSLPRLSLMDARHLYFVAQGLLKKTHRRAAPADILATISRTSLLQIDAINTIARSPYLMLSSRLDDHSPQQLGDSLQRGKLMGYWAHEACSLPRSDFMLIRHHMSAPENMGWKYKVAQMKEHVHETEQLPQHIQYNGSIRSVGSEHPRKGTSGRWEWKPQKRRLEGLFTAGKVMVVERRNFQRVYGLTHRAVPHQDDERDPLSQKDVEGTMLDNSARSLGIFRKRWLVDYYRLKRPVLKSWCNERAEQWQIIPVDVEGLGVLWLYNCLQLLLEQALTGRLTVTHSAVLSPFGLVVQSRKRAEQLFDFNYRLECYTPAPKRQYGYFVLPLPRHGQLVGRMDVKVHRKTGVLDVISLWLQNGAKPEVASQERLFQAIGDSARWQ